MATLHVRNVPDELYDLLRDRAGSNDRSIGAETVQLLQQGLATQSGERSARRIHLPRRRRPPATGTFARFSPQSRRVVVDAQEHARELGHDRVGTGHLLLAMFDVDESQHIVRALDELGLTADTARAEVERLTGRGDAHLSGQIPFQPCAKQALEVAVKEADRLGDAQVSPEHIMLGLIAQETGPGARILRTVEPDANELRAKVTPAGSRRPSDPDSTTQFRVVQLDGDAATWEAALNNAAAGGYDLSEIVEGRAILRLDGADPAERPDPS